MKLHKGLLVGLYTLISIFAIPNLLCQNPEWKMVDNLEEFSLSRSYYKIQCSDSNNCIVWGASGGSDWCQFFRQTTDGGDSWKDIFIDSTIAISEKPLRFKHIIQFKDFAYKGNTIIAVGDSGRILTSFDNGKSFSEQYILDSNCTLTKIKLSNSSYGILYGFPNDKTLSFFYETNDCGKSWKKINIPDSLSKQIDKKTSKQWGLAYEDYYILKPGLFVAYLNRIYANPKLPELAWIYGNVDSVRILNQDYIYTSGFNIFFLNSKEGWMVGGGKLPEDTTNLNLTNLIFHTTNGGISWVIQRDTMFTGTSVKGIDAFDNKFAMATTGDGYVLMTHNGGRTWVEEQVDSIPNGWFATARYPQITSYSSAYVLLTSPYFIYKYTRDWSKPVDTSTVSVRNEEILKNEYNIYPNPVKEKFSISDFSEGKIEFEIYDNLGIKRLEGNVFNEIYVEFLPKGIYFLKLNKNNKVIKFIKE